MSKSSLCSLKSTSKSCVLVLLACIYLLLCFIALMIYFLMPDITLRSGKYWYLFS
uniref:Uncharacterized protein n=1 Tax=Arundo donax TaxID=35708 RepID=A0A0A8ZMT1_ARUDO